MPEDLQKITSSAPKDENVAAVRDRAAAPPGPAAPDRSCRGACRCGRSRARSGCPREAGSPAGVPTRPAAWGGAPTGLHHGRHHRRDRSRIHRTLDPHPDTAVSAISIDPGCRSVDSRLRIHRRARNHRHIRHDLDRHQASRRHRRWRGYGHEPTPPLEQLVGVHIVPPGHDRHRGTRLERRCHQLPLQRFRPAATLATRLLGVRFAVSGHLFCSQLHGAESRRHHL